MNELETAVVDPPRGCADLSDIGGRARARPEDFEVEEIPAYEPDSKPGHLLIRVAKRSMTSEDAARALARQLQIPRAEIGVAGQKDRDAVTRQWMSVPERAAAHISAFSHPQIELGPPQPHSHKLRRGHVRGNRFQIVVRDLDMDPAAACSLVEAKLARIQRDGLRNYYGSQRFGRGARNLAPGLAALAGRGPRRGKGNMVVSAGQSALFNLALVHRIEQGLLGKVLEGDVLQKRETGGMFTSEDATTDSTRMAAGELVATGPMFGSKMRWPTAGSASEAFELEVLAAAQLDREGLATLGRKIPGTRRRFRVWPEQLAVEPAPAVGALAPGVRLSFVLPSGTYATIVLRELCGPEEQISG